MSEVINLNDSSPAAPAGGQNVQWQKGATTGIDPESGYPVYPVSAYVTGLTGGVNAQTGNYTIVAADNGKLISVNAAGADTTLLLPNPPPSPTWSCFIENVGTGQLTVSPNGLQIDDDDPALVLNQDQGIYVATDGTNYFTERGGGGGGGGSSLTLETNGTLNGSQTLQNLVAGAGIVITDDGAGDITIATGTGPVTAPVLRGSTITSGNNVTSLSVALPSGAAAGDLAIVFAAGSNDNSGDYPTVPSGWSSLSFPILGDWSPMGASKILTSADIAAGSVSSSYPTFAGPNDGVLTVVVFIGPTGGIRETESANGTGGTTLTLTNMTTSAVESTDAAIYFASARSGYADPLPTIVPASGAATTLQSALTTGSYSQSVLADQSMPGGAISVANTFTEPGAGAFALQVIVEGVANGGGGGGGSSLTPYHEVPSGAIDGENQTFTLSRVPAANTLIYERNGNGQGDLKSPPDFTLSGYTITTATPLKPASGSVTADWHFAHYWA